MQIDKLFDRFIRNYIYYETSPASLERWSKADLDSVFDARFIQTVSLLIATFSLPGFFRIYEVYERQNYNISLVLSLVSILLLLLVATLRKSLSKNVFVFSIFTVLGFLIVMNFAAFGTFSGISLMAGCYPLVAFILAPPRIALAFSLTTFAGIALVSIGYVTGILEPVIDGLAFPTDPLEWARTDFALFALGTIFGLTGLNIRRTVVDLLSRYIELFEQKTTMYENMLSLQEEQKNIFNMLADLFYRVDSSSKFTLVSPSVKEILGRDISEMSETYFIDVFESRAQAAEFLESVKSNSYAQANLRLKKKNGQIKWFAVNGKKLSSADGTYNGFEGIIRDVDKEIIEQDVARTKGTYESLGRLAGGVAHDFNNILAVISAHAELCQNLAASGPEVKDISSSEFIFHLNEIIKAVSRGSELTHQLLLYSPKGRLEEKQLVNVNDSLKTIRKVITRSLGGIIHFDYELTEIDNKILVSPSLFLNAVMALYINAKESMSSGGTLVTITKLVPASTVEKICNQDFAAAEFIELSINSSSSRMVKWSSNDDPDLASSTPRLENQLTGLGLSPVYALVSAVGGGMRIQTFPMGGTSVSLYLPVFAEMAQEADQSNLVHTPEQTNARLLYVEDNRELREMTKGFMEKYGFEVSDFGTAVEAILSLDHHQDFDVLLTDIMLPGGIDGIELAQHVKKIIPDIGIVFVTGNPNQSVLVNQEENISDRQATLFKPYMMDKLALTLRRTMGRDLKRSPVEGNP